MTDLRNGTTTYTFEADQVQTITTPNPGTGAQVTTFLYDNLGRVTGTVYPDQTSETRVYSKAGQVTLVFGSRTCAAGYSYDYAGRLRRMTNWSAFNPATQTGSGARTTTWNYSSTRGWLTGKRDANNSGPDYGYSAGGRLKTRQWARTGTTSRVRATYLYGFEDATANNDHGDLVRITYSYDPASTPTVYYSYDRWGRVATTSQGGGTATLTYNDANQFTGESYAGGTLGGLSVTAGYNPQLQREWLAGGGFTGYGLAYTYDASGRLWTLNDGTSIFTYGYVPSSMLVQTVSSSGTAGNLTSTRNYDSLNRLRSISSLASAVPMPASYAYQYNAANQRDRATLADGSYWSYGYDSLGQVTSGKHYWKDGTPVAGQQNEYVFDTIGNRTSTKAGGDSAGGSLRSATYTPNNLNQYTSRTVPAYADILGLAVPSQPVTVNGNATYRKGEYFHHALSTPNSGSPWNNTVTVVSGTESTSGNLYVPQSAESFYYDFDGNLTNDSRWVYTWDAENRLIKMISKAGAPANNVQFGYDWQGRRISKKVWNNTAGTGTPVVNERYLYDGWNLIAVIDGSAATLMKSFVWGTDLSGTLQGAGGVGGLLKVRQHSPSVSNAYVAYDGNGNVVGLVNTADGKFSARYEYGPFGEVIRATGPLAKINSLRFSTKYQDDETDLLYYGYRYYDANRGRWISRDPIEEEGGENLYALVSNNPLKEVDYIGMCACDVQSLEITSQNWVGGWPSWTLGGRRYTKQFRTEFKLVLKPGSDKKCCLIKQNKKGRVSTGSGVANDIFPSWAADLGAWWDGSRWTTTWGGSWNGLTATWKDEPGFNNLKKSDFPVYFGSQVGPGTFDFNTYVVDACKPTFPRVAEIFWGMYIEYSAPDVGNQYHN